MRRHWVFVWVLAFAQIFVRAQHVRWVNPGGQPTAIVAGGKYVVTGDASGLLQVWDISGGTPIFVKTLGGLSIPVWRMSISDDGGTVVAEDGNLHVGIWTLPNGPDTVMGMSRFEEVTHQPHANRLLMRNDSSTIHVANLAGGFNGFSSSFDPSLGAGSGALRATSDDDLIAFVIGPQATLYRISTGQSSTFSPPNQASGGAVAFSADATKLAMSARKSETDTNQNSILIWDIATHSIVKTLQGADAISLSFSPDGTRLLVVGSLYELFVWDIQSGTGRHIENPNHAPATFISNDVLALGKETLNLTTGERRFYSRTSSMPLNLAFNADGSLISDGVSVWDASTGALRIQLNWPVGLPGGPMIISSRLIRAQAPLKFLENDTKLIVGSHIFSLASGDQIGMLQGIPLAFGNDWHVSLEPSSTDIAALRSYSTGDVIRELRLTGFSQTYSGAISPSQTLVATGGAVTAADVLTAYNVRLWDAATGNLARTASSHVGVASQLMFSSDERLIAAAGEQSGSFAGVWDVQTGQEILISYPFAPEAEAMAFLPGSDFLIEGYDGLNVWDLHASNIVTRLTNELQHVATVVVSPDGSKLAAGRLDGSVVMIDMSAPDRLSLDRVRSQPVLSFFARNGVNYTLESSGDMQTWTLVTNVVGTGARVTKAVPSDRSIFYRLR